MKTLPLSIELSSLALETSGKPMGPGEWLGKVKHFLSRHANVVGNMNGSHLHRREILGEDLRLDEYLFVCENCSLQFQLVRFRPRGEWQVKGFRFI